MVNVPITDGGKDKPKLEKVYPSSYPYLQILMWKGECVNEMSREEMINVIDELGGLYNSSIEMHRKQVQTMTDMLKRVR